MDSFGPGPSVWEDAAVAEATHKHTHRLVRIHEVKCPKMFTIRSSGLDKYKKMEVRGWLQ